MVIISTFGLGLLVMIATSLERLVTIVSTEQPQHVAQASQPQRVETVGPAAPMPAPISAAQSAVSTPLDRLQRHSVPTSQNTSS
jgi:hypothetical protein